LQLRAAQSVAALRQKGTAVYKCVWMIKFRSELDPEDVREAWRTTHAALALKIPGIRRYVQNHWVADPMGAERTYDGTVDCWFDDRESFEAAWSSLEWKALLEDDLRLFDRTVTPAFEGGVVNEYVMRWDALPDGRFYLASGPAAGDQSA
jgi:uncharacterized protein (TIGR02118 family)